eukprot:5625211-Pyramimonas_sp.AAC.1
MSRTHRGPLPIASLPPSLHASEQPLGALTYEFRVLARKLAQVGRLALLAHLVCYIRGVAQGQAQQVEVVDAHQY